MAYRITLVWTLAFKGGFAMQVGGGFVYFLNLGVFFKNQQDRFLSQRDWQC